MRRHGPRHRTRPGRLAAPLLAALVAGLCLAACTSARNTLGPTESPCFRVLAKASEAVHHSGRFTGVRYLSVAELADVLRRARPQLVDVPHPLKDAQEGVCVVAFTGRFASAAVERGWSVDTAVGRLALVVVGLKDQRVLATVVLPKPPLRLTRLLPATH